MFERQIIKFYNGVTKLRKTRVPPENLLLMLPHCLQWSECTQNIVADLGNCKRCGKCAMAALLELAETYGIQHCVASGGRQAAAAVRDPSVKAVVAVACEKELAQGILATLPKPIVAVENAQPCGFCHNTTVDCAKVETAIRSVLADAPLSE